MRVLHVECASPPLSLATALSVTVAATLGLQLDAEPRCELLSVSPHAAG